MDKIKVGEVEISVDGDALYIEIGNRTEFLGKSEVEDIIDFLNEVKDKLSDNF